jgi:Phospholipase_D-nuclease N-terminal
VSVGIHVEGSRAMNLWGFAGYFFVSFVFVAYLVALFSVFFDIFRDHELGGWGKSLWVLFLIFVPVVTLLVYVIARGEGMAARSSRSQHRDAGAESARYISEAEASSSPSEEIRKAQILYKDDMITLAEYDSLKAQALSDHAPSGNGTPVR